MDLGESCAGLLPHRPPMILLDRLVRSDADSASAEWRVPTVGPWIRSGKLDRGALLEVAAQTAAAGAGMERVRRGLPPLPGALGGLRSVRFHGDALAGDRLLARTTVRLRFERLVRVDFRVDREGRPLCDGEMTLAIGVKPEAPGGRPDPEGTE